MQELQSVRTIGTGTFGRVKLVLHRRTGTVWALKIQQKAHIVKNKQQRSVVKEKQALAAMDHPFIIRLEATYQDRDTLYMLLECCLGGELFALLDKQYSLSLHQSLFYAACVFSALAHVHRALYIYRDLKPENLLFDPQGYIKMCDFGFAKSLQSEVARTFTICGTPDYFAPELIKGKGYGRSVDIWGVGILLYEMLFGAAPFTDESYNTKAICQNILTKPLQYPTIRSAVTADEKAARAILLVKDLIGRLLQRNPVQRIGCGTGARGFDEIRGHPIFAQFNWEALLAKRLPAPWVPPLRGATDTSLFDQYEESADRKSVV